LANRTIIALATSRSHCSVRRCRDWEAQLAEEEEKEEKEEKDSFSLLAVDDEEDEEDEEKKVFLDALRAGFALTAVVAALRRGEDSL